MPQEPIHLDDRNLEEELSAYLDGELDDESARRIEHLLASDPQVRDTLAHLERTWRLLDKLDETEVDEDFTRSTMEMVALEVEKEVQAEAAAAPVRRRRRWGVRAAALLTAVAAGFAAVALLWPDPNRQLLDDLPVIEHLDEYRQVEDFEFLQKLHEEGLFQEDRSDGK